jgi:hypothetical protein
VWGVGGRGAGGCVSGCCEGGCMEEDVGLSVVQVQGGFYFCGKHMAM